MTLFEFTKSVGCTRLLSIRTILAAKAVLVDGLSANIAASNAGLARQTVGAAVRRIQQAHGGLVDVTLRVSAANVPKLKRFARRLSQ
jgi:hypothetical protein